MLLLSKAFAPLVGAPSSWKWQAMKCQKCDKTATFHITEITEGHPEELHLCQEHAQHYLTQGDDGEGGASSLAEALAHQLQVSNTAEELARLDEQTCPICGISFYEFRNQGRLGCPNDYVCFESHLEPLLLNIHGETAHVGKHPLNGPQDSMRQAELIRMRRDMKEAVDAEEYERASELRDEIRRMEGAARGKEPKKKSGKQKEQPGKGGKGKQRDDA